MKFNKKEAFIVANKGDLMHTTKMLYAALDRIRELEKALTEERASRIIEGSYEGCPVPDEEIVSPDTDCECWKDLEHCPESKYFRKKAREQLQTEGILP